MKVPVLVGSLVAAPAIAFAPAVSAQQGAAAPAATAPAGSTAEGDKVRQLIIGNKPWTGDFDRMLERRLIRIYAPFSRSLYFSDKGRERGLAVELARDFERYLNIKHAKQLGKRPLTIYIMPATRDKLLPDLEAGLTDIAVGNLTVTEERQQRVDFVPGDEGRRTIDEVIVTGPAGTPVASLDDLAGRRVHVRKASSYHDSLQALSQRLEREGKKPIDLVLVPDALEDEDMMDMLSAGLFEILVVDDWKARMWAQVLPKIKVRTDLVLRDDARTGWAIRKGSPQLFAEIDDFFRNWAIKQGVADSTRASTHCPRPIHIWRSELARPLHQGLQKPEGLGRPRHNPLAAPKLRAPGLQLVGTKGKSRAGRHR